VRGVQLRYQFRVYPTPGQQALLARAFGCARVVFNDAVALRRAMHAAGEKISDTEVQRRVVTVAKQTRERAWLSEVASVVLVQAVGDARVAHKNFLDSVTRRRAGRKISRPRFRSRKDTRHSIRLTRNGFSLRDNGRLYVAKVGELEVRWSRDLPSIASSVTVICDSAGRYFASFVVNVDNQALPEADAEIGIDLGLASYAVDSKGRVIDNPRVLRRHERRLRKAQKSLSRKAKGSNNRAKARVKVAGAHARVADTRRDWLHQITTRLIRENQAIYLEDLAVAGLGRTRLAKSVHDAAWGAFRRILEDKAQRYGRHVGIIGRFEPTSQTCSDCGVKDGPKPLAVRSWTCQNCFTAHDRDRNAARNILALGRRERLNACGGTVRPGNRRAGASEAGTRRGAARTPRVSAVGILAV
jgi:putative transposase